MPRSEIECNRCIESLEERLYWARLVGAGFLKPAELKSGLAAELKV